MNSLQIDSYDNGNDNNEDTCHNINFKLKIKWIKIFYFFLKCIVLYLEFFLKQNKY